jgi:hypothetical protein
MTTISQSDHAPAMEVLRWHEHRKLTTKAQRASVVIAASAAGH